VSEIAIAQSQGMPIIVPGSIIAKYCLTAALWQENKPAKTNPMGTTTQAATTRPVPQNANAKRDNNTPEGGTLKDPSQQQKRTCRTPGMERSAFARKDLGMFYLKNPAMLKGNVFPKELSKPLCVPYTCKELECNDENFRFAHPRQALDIEISDVEKIAIYFKTNKHGYLSKYHFRKLKKVSEAVKSVWGGAGGLANSKTN
jgi:hypothetical protein